MVVLSLFLTEIVDKYQKLESRIFLYIQAFLDYDSYLERVVILPKKLWHKSGYGTQQISV